METRLKTPGERVDLSVHSQPSINQIAAAVEHPPEQRSLSCC